MQTKEIKAVGIFAADRKLETFEIKSIGKKVTKIKVCDLAADSYLVDSCKECEN